MSPAKPKPPRPVTAWVRPDDLQRLSRDVDAETAIEAFATGTGSEIRCRVTPIRDPNAAEVQKLASWLEKMAEQSGLPCIEPAHWRDIARFAWKKGARP